MDFEQILADLKIRFTSLFIYFMGRIVFIDELTNYIQQNVLTETEKAFNQDIAYGKDITATNLIELSRAFPMMANYRVVILKEAQGLKDFKNLEPYVQNPVNSTILVLSFKNTAKIDRRLKVFNLLSKNAVVFESKRLYENQVYPWIEKL